MTLLGLTLDEAAQRLRATGVEPRIVYTAAPARAVQTGDAAARPGDDYVARIIQADCETLICAWFHEPDIS